MKKHVLLLLVIVCFPMSLVLVPASANSQEVIAIDVQREVHLEEYGLLIVNDTFTVTNVGLEPVFNVWAAFPIDLEEHIRYFRAETFGGNLLLSQRVSLIGSNCTGWKIYVPEPVMPGENFTYKTVMVLEGLTQLTDGSHALCTFSTVPTSPYIIKQCSTTFSYYKGASQPSQSSFSAVNVHPLSYRPTNVTLTINKPIIVYPQLIRRFMVDPWGYLHVLEVHTLKMESVRPSGWDYITTVMPPGSQFIRAYDDVGNLSVTITNMGNVSASTTLNVNMRFNLRRGDVYRFFLEYRIPLEICQSTAQNGMFLKLDPYYGHPWIVRKQITEAILPVGSQPLSIPSEAEVTLATGQYVIRFYSYNVTSRYCRSVTIHFVYPLQPAFVRPLLLALLFGVVCLVYIAGRRIPILREEEIIVAPAAIDPALLGEFCALYGEKVALLLQTERLERDMLAQKISKPRYRKQKKIFEKKLRALERDLKSRIGPLLEAGGKYEASVRQLELLEGERLSAIEGLRALEQRYKQKRITPSVYQRLRAELEKRRDKAVSNMDKILLSLREEIIG